MSVTRVQKDLGSDLGQLLAQFENKFRSYYKTKGLVNAENLVKKQFENIYKEYQLEADKYSEVIKWCEQSDSTDEFKALKKSFLFGLHEVHFHDRIKLYKNELDKIIEILQLSKKTLIAENKQEIENISAAIAKERQLWAELKDSAKKLNVETDSYQDFIHKMKYIIAKERLKPGPISTIAELITHDQPQTPNFLLHRKQQFLTILDNRVKAYQAQLSNEPWYMRIIHFFSPTRRRRKASLAQYNNDVINIPVNSIDVKYDCACRWINDQLKLDEFNTRNQEDDLQQILESSKTQNSDAHITFYSVILLSYYDRKQISFESIDAINKFNQKEIDNIIEEHKKIIAEHAENAGKLHKNLSKIVKDRNAFQEKYNDFISLVSKVESLANKIYITNDKEIIEQKWRSITYSLSFSKNEEIEHEAKVLIQKVEALKDNADATEEEYQAIANFILPLRQDKIAAPIFSAAIDKIIADVEKIANNGFTSTTDNLDYAEKAIQMLVPDKSQEKRFSNLKKAALKHEKQRILDEEKRFVTILEKELELNTYGDQLLNWRSAQAEYHQAKQKLKPGDPEIESNPTILHIKKVKSKAMEYHANGGTVLAGLVKKIVSEYLEKANKSEPKTKSFSPGLFTPTKKHYESLSWEQVDTFVVIYGTKDQIKKWHKVPMPIANDEPVITVKQEHNNACSIM
jgi:hypothetical protein